MGIQAVWGWLRLALPGAAVSALIVGAEPALASDTIGQIGPPGGCVTGYDDIQGAVPSGNSYVVPGTGTITSWTTWAGPTGGQMTMKIYRKVADPDIFKVVGHDARGLLGGGTAGNTFPVNIAVQPGDMLGFSTPGPNDGCFLQGEQASGDYFYRYGDLGDGFGDQFEASSPGRLDIQAVFEPNAAGPSDTKPSNAFSFIAITRNNKKGTATLTMNVTNPGELTGSGKGAKVARAAGAVTSKAVSAGNVQLLIKAKGKKRKRLNETGKVKLKVAVTYTPTGGDPNTQSRKLKLKKR